MVDLPYVLLLPLARRYDFNWLHFRERMQDSAAVVVRSGKLIEGIILMLSAFTLQAQDREISADLLLRLVWFFQ